MPQNELRPVFAARFEPIVSSWSVCSRNYEATATPDNFASIGNFFAMLIVLAVSGGSFGFNKFLEGIK